MSLATRGFQIVSSIAALCVLAAAGAALAGDPNGSTDGASAAASDLSGRWEGRTFELARAKDCGEGPCTLALDLVRCASGWCGVEVTGGDHKCGATALRLDGGTAGSGGGATVFRGKLELAKGTEPYVVEAYLIPPLDADDKTELQIAGDTGGEFRMFRRSFPFNATLARTGDAKCRPESTVSALVE